MFSNIRSQWRLVAAKVTDSDIENFRQLHAGGFSHNPVTGHRPDSGYMVGMAANQGGHPRTIPIHELTPQHLADHREELEKAGHFDHSESHQGGWVENGHAYLDVSKNIQDKDEAIREGKKHDQIAIYDIKNNADVATGGSGES